MDPVLMSRASIPEPCLQNVSCRVGPYSDPRYHRKYIIIAFNGQEFVCFSDADDIGKAQVDYVRSVEYYFESYLYEVVG